MAVPRSMTPAEKSRFKGYFPNLNVNAAVVTGEATRAYNCISWTVGVTSRWLWPGSTIQHFDTFYRQFGYVRVSNGPIAAWGHSTSNMTHGSISGAGHGPRWESKCGQDLRIQHGLGELTGSSYGRVVAFYGRSLSFAMFASNVVKVIKQHMKTLLSANEKKAVRRIAKSVDAETREAFSATFAAWKKTWFEGGLAINSNPHARTVGREFDALIALGHRILPLVVEAMADEENFIALQLYDVLQPDHELVIQYEPEDERILRGEQGRAVDVVKLWLSREGGGGLTERPQRSLAR